MGIADGSHDKSVNKGFGWTKYVLIGGFLLLFLVMLFYMYRSVGYIGTNRTYGCVEDDIALIDTVNDLYDIEEGFIYDDAGVLAEKASEGVEAIEKRGVCLEGYVESAMSELSEKQNNVDVRALAYLQLVRDVAGSDDPETEMSEKIDALDLAHDQFRTAVSEYEDEVVKVEARFFLTVL